MTRIRTGGSVNPNDPALRAAIDAEGQAQGWGSGGGVANLAVVDALPNSPLTGTVYIVTGFTQDTTDPTTPGTPTATAGNAQATVTFGAATDNVGVTGYRVYSSADGYTSPVATGTASPITITGLTNGTAVTFKVSAGDAAGNWSPLSAASNSVTPAPTMPGAPTGVTATPGNGQASVAFTPPATDGGAPISGYTATSTPGGLTASGASSPLVVTGLTNGTAYTFTVHATNSVGNSAESASSNSVTPTAGATVPDPPTIGAPTAGNAQATVPWTAPASNGGAAITDYVVQYSSDGGTTWTTFPDGTSTATSATVTGLTNGTAYVFHVAAVNSVGQGVYSATSAPVTPAAPAATTLDSSSFTKADGSGLPNTDQGRTWTTFGVAGTAATFGTASNQARVFTTTAANPTGAVVDVATADVTVQGTIAVIGATSPGLGLVVGYADVGNFIYATQSGLSKYVGGTFTSLGSFPTAFVAGDVMKISRTGSAVNVYKNGALVLSKTVADAAIVAATQHGFAFRGNDALSRLDDWSVTTP